MSAGTVARGEQAQRLAGSPVAAEQSRRKMVLVERVQLGITGGTGELQARRHAARHDAGGIEQRIGHLDAEEQISDLGQRCDRRRFRVGRRCPVPRRDPMPAPSARCRSTGAPARGWPPAGRCLAPPGRLGSGRGQPTDGGDGRRCRGRPGPRRWWKPLALHLGEWRDLPGRPESLIVGSHHHVPVADEARQVVGVVRSADRRASATWRRRTPVRRRSSRGPRRLLASPPQADDRGAR